MSDPDREYPAVVAAAIRSLIDTHKAPDNVGPDEIEKVVFLKQQSWPAIINAERADWLRGDLRDLVDHYWGTLTDRKNRGHFDEIVRGALR